MNRRGVPHAFLAAGRLDEECGFVQSRWHLNIADRLEGRVGDMTQLAFPDESFDRSAPRQAPTAERYPVSSSFAMTELGRPQSFPIGR